MVNARKEIELRSRAIASGELPMPEQRAGEADADWLERVANGRAPLPAIGDRFVATVEFLATNAFPLDHSTYRVLVTPGDVLTVSEVLNMRREIVVSLEVDGSQVLVEPQRLARYCKPCRGPLPGASNPQSESAGESFEPSSTTP